MGKELSGSEQKHPNESLPRCYYMRVFSVLIPLVIVCAITMVSCARATVEQPAYNVTKKLPGGIELREYGELKMVATPMVEGPDGGDPAFSKLFEYIRGENAEKRKIAMTSPVMVVPDEKGRSMGFIVPKDVAAGTIPEPTAEPLRITSIPKGTFAVLRFEGRRNGANEKSAKERLFAGMATNKLESFGDVRFAYYDPPWTPVAWRRNEVMVQVKSENPGAP